MAVFWDKNAIHQIDGTFPSLPAENSGQVLTSVRYFRNSYAYLWDSTTMSSIGSLFDKLDARNAHNISFEIPQLHCWGSYETSTATRLFEMNTRTSVREILTQNGEIKSNKIIITKDCGSHNPFSTNDDTVYWSDGSRAGLKECNDFEVSINMKSDEFVRNLFNAPVLATSSSNFTNKKVEFITKVLEDGELTAGYKYEYIIECYALPANSSGLFSYYEKKETATAYYISQIIPGDPPMMWYVPFANGYVNTAKNLINNPNLIGISQLANTAISFVCGDTSVNAEGGAFIRKGHKYNAYDLLRRALLTCDTHLVDYRDTSGNLPVSLDEIGYSDKDQKSLEHSIIVDNGTHGEESRDWASRLKVAVMQETVFEGKNLWEVLLQLGYYLHAIPYLEFAPPSTNTDGTVTPQDKFVLKFRQLGDTKTKQDDTIKTSIFTSRNLQDFFTQYDAYVTNMFSPQNVVDEWIVPKTSDSSWLISNDTAELQTSRPILEILEFDIIPPWWSGSIPNELDGRKKPFSALTYIFESSIYNILTSDDPTRVKPAKGNAVYYELATNKILGLNYTSPNKDGKPFDYSMQIIIGRLFGSSDGIIPSNVKLNEYRFHIKYKTQDSLRVSQMRPDLIRFMKNSAYEKYPHHEQFYGQQDKIVDSERFSANLYGKLIRVGNNTYQCNEYAMTPEQAKEAGDLVTINGEPYYVTQVENELYPDAILQKVSYSKNFNQLSQIVTIPSEPRFYEVSERSKIRREVRIMEFFELSTQSPKEQFPLKPKFISTSKAFEFIKSVIFGDANANYKHPNFAYTKFMADYNRVHTGSFGQVIVSPIDPLGDGNSILPLFPSSEIDRQDTNNIKPKGVYDHADCMTTLLYYPLHDGIVFEWDMEDNFKAGDSVDTGVSGNAGTVNKAFYAQQSVRYVDILGRADLFRFALLNQSDFNITQAQDLPKSPIDDATAQAQATFGMQGNSSTLAIALDKDNREELSFNYQINLLHKNQDGDDDFITFPNLFGSKISKLKCALLSQPQSMFAEQVEMNGNQVLADDVPYTLTNSNGITTITFSTNINWTNNNVSSGGDITKVNAVVLYQTDENDNPNSRYAYICKNISKLPDSEKLQPWYIYPVYSE